MPSLPLRKPVPPFSALGIRCLHCQLLPKLGVGTRFGGPARLVLGCMGILAPRVWGSSQSLGGMVKHFDGFEAGVAGAAFPWSECGNRLGNGASATRAAPTRFNSAQRRRDGLLVVSLIDVKGGRGGDQSRTSPLLLRLGWLSGLFAEHLCRWGCGPRHGQRRASLRVSRLVYFQVVQHATLWSSSLLPHEQQFFLQTMCSRPPRSHKGLGGSFSRSSNAHRLRVRSKHKIGQLNSRKARGATQSEMGHSGPRWARWRALVALQTGSHTKKLQRS